MYSFKKTYNFTTKESFLWNPRGFAYWLYRHYERIQAACFNDEIPFKVFRNGVLEMIRRADSLPGRDRFICDVYDYKTKEQILERCESAIENARACRVS